MQMGEPILQIVLQIPAGKGLDYHELGELLQVPTFFYKFQQSTILISSIDFYRLSNIYIYIFDAQRKKELCQVSPES